ncbi:hypothetical protein DACRYDRAFT_19308 [Dacryopinax primogenitus]|uniref:Uncharacterized protein n=1 Tax=Dacryopinax primogenitus (strain DJM 731) TaxID=1858805 RepID=M5GBW9_DACPD|nr:uncharacterized protein DACRYDRAFT_19308 [Dacryopinax primogenitus]EJU05950.1 hypothetical protein DACRYDRAFT_19308 [Dacryopinax primogenitus]
MLFLRSRTGTDAELPISSLTIHYMVRASITILPGHGAEYTLYCIPTPDGEKPVYVVPGPLTRVTIWNLEEERDPAGVVLQWSVTVNGAPPERCMYANDTLNIEGFEADLNGMVTITLTAN